jgi:ABC-type Fe3+ transport system permease subunit
VFLWDHETHEISETAPDLDRFVAARAREDEESRREFAVREQERRREEREWARRAWRIIAIGFFLVIVLPLLLLALLVWVNSQRRGAV